MHEDRRGNWAKGRTAANDIRVARMAAAKTGKPNWARGQTAQTDPRIARNAASRIGRPRGPYRSRMSGRGIAWSADLAYAVGLLATDGCLVRGRSIDFTSTDRDLVETFLHCIRRTDGHIGHRVRRERLDTYRAQIGDVGFYRWLLSVGLTPRKSLTLGAIDVPDAYLLDLTRGLLDGDGSIVNYWYEVPGGTRPYEALYSVFCSASVDHLTWLRARLLARLGISGALNQKRRRAGLHDLFVLKYAKRESGLLLPALYDRDNAPRLHRKWRIWEAYCRRSSRVVGASE